MPINKSRNSNWSWFTIDQMLDGVEEFDAYDVTIIAVDIPTATFVPVLTTAASVVILAEYQVS